MASARYGKNLQQVLIVSSDIMGVWITVWKLEPHLPGDNDLILPPNVYAMLVVKRATNSWQDLF